MAQVEALAEISRDLLQRFQSTPVPSDQYTPYVRNFDHFLRIALEYGELRGIGVVAAAWDDNPYHSIDRREGGRIMNGISYWSLPKKGLDYVAHMNPDSHPTAKLALEFYKAGENIASPERVLVEAGFMFMTTQEEYPTLEDLQRTLEDSKRRGKFSMWPGSGVPNEFWGITSMGQLREEFAKQICKKYIEASI